MCSGRGGVLGVQGLVRMNVDAGMCSGGGVLSVCRAWVEGNVIHRSHGGTLVLRALSLFNCVPQGGT